MNRARILSTAALAALVFIPARGDVKLCRIFTDHMVLQQGVPVNVWGTGDVGEAVTATIADQTKSATADGNGKWSVQLDPLKTGDPLTLTLQGKNTIRIQDVLVGEVWVCSGQSNMTFNLGSATNGSQEVANSTDPQLRMMNVGASASLTPLDDFRDGHWDAASPQVTSGWSAVGYFFGRELRKALHVPIGIIHSSSGGTDAEGWVSADAMLGSPKFHDVAAQKIAATNRLPADLSAFEPATNDWITAHSYQDQGNQGETDGWARPDFDDSSWKTVNVPGFLHDDGMKGGGVVWWRKSLDWPADAPAKDCTLKTNWTGGVVTTYFNGEQLKELGAAPPFSGRQRIFLLPGRLIHPGQPNVVAVRQYTLSPDDGFINDTRGMELPLPPDVTKGNNAWKFKIEQAFGPMTAEMAKTLPKWPQVTIASTPGGLFNAFIHPMIQYPVKGVVWYQGENNVSRAGEYFDLLSLLIQDWRHQWNENNMPFVIEQIANYGSTGAQPRWSNQAWLREVQQQVSQAVRDCGLAVAIDIGEENIHPKDKRDVGLRTGLVARALVYGEKVEDSGPEFQMMSAEQNGLVLGLEHAVGLFSKGGPPKEFAVAGKDKKFFWADAKIEGETVIVSSPQVLQPVAVRYGWDDNPQNCNVYNAAGLPLAPFRTDRWNP